jgi:hypothetical protein
MAHKMNVWGPSGCREHREEILDRLRSAYGKSSVSSRLLAGANAVAKGLPFTLEGLLDLAIERSEPGLAITNGN